MATTAAAKTPDSSTATATATAMSNNNVSVPGSSHRPLSPPPPPPPPALARGSLITHLDTSAPAINSTPVEMDGTPTSSSPRDKLPRGAGWSRSGGGGGGGGGGVGSSPDHLAREEEVLEEFGLAGSSEAEKRAALLRQRKSNPAVLVDIPQGPSVEDFAAASAVRADDGAERR